VLEEILDERVASSRNRRNQRGVKPPKPALPRLFYISVADKVRFASAM
jgi:hypothetical protein